MDLLDECEQLVRVVGRLHSFALLGLNHRRLVSLLVAGGSAGSLGSSRCLNGLFELGVDASGVVVSSL